MNDPHDLNRFFLAQQDDYERALAEIKNGRKRTHWMWYFRKLMGWGLAPWRGSTESKAPTKHARISLIPSLVPGCWRARKRWLPTREATPVKSSAHPTILSCDHPPRSLPACPRQTRCSTVCWRSSIQVVPTRKRSDCSTSATSVEGSPFAGAVREGAVRTISFFLFKTGQTGRSLSRCPNTPRTSRRSSWATNVPSGIVKAEGDRASRPFGRQFLSK
jgi:Protein of unknown function (DUF1810)